MLFRSPEAAKQNVARMAAVMKRARARLQPHYARAYAEAMAKRLPGLQARSAQFDEDDSYRVVWQREGGEFLKKDLQMQAVLAAYGKPEKTTTEVVHARGDRRPAVLTLHHYAGGAIRFVQSDLSPTPGLVDRVILDVTAATALIFAGPR